MNKGFVKLYRSILEWEWWNDHNTTRLFIYILVQANSDDKEWRGQIVPRGSFITSRSTLSSETGLSEQQVRTAISHLISTNEISVAITSKSTKKLTKITVCNYEKYQYYQPSNQPANQPSINQQINQETNQQNNQETNQDNILGVNQIPILPTGQSTSNSTKKSTSKTTTTKNNKEYKEDYKEEDKSSSSSVSQKIPYDEIKDLWNKTCTALSEIKVMSAARKEKIRVRWKEFSEVDEPMAVVGKLFENLQTSHFITQTSRENWRKKCFDWLFENSNNWVKVYEGNYNGGGSAQQDLFSQPLRYDDYGRPINNELE